MCGETLNILIIQISSFASCSLLWETEYHIIFTSAPRLNCGQGMHHGILSFSPDAT